MINNINPNVIQTIIFIAIMLVWAINHDNLMAHCRPYKALISHFTGKEV